MNPFATPDKILNNKKKFSLANHSLTGDGFFIDSQYQTPLGGNISIKKINLAFLIIILFTLLLLSRIFYLQIIKGYDFYLIAENNRIKTEVVPSPRGLIYDRYQNQLVKNLPRFNLLVSKDSFNSDSESEKLISQIKKLTQLETSTIKEHLEKFKTDQSNDFFVFTINYQNALTFMAQNDSNSSFKIQVDSQRQYLYPSLSHTLGYLGKIDPEEWPELKNQAYQLTDLHGKSGLEKQYESLLRGQPGKIEYEVNAQNQIIKNLNQLEPQAGSNLILTIDAKLNQKVYEILLETTQELNCPQAAAIISNPQNGEILSLVSLPGFDNNVFSDPSQFASQIEPYFNNPHEPLFNRPLSGEYPSGSTIKPLIAAAALEEQLITPATSILSTGGIKIDQWFFPDWKAGGHGLTNIIKALSESVNTFFYYLGGGYQNFRGLGLEKINQYATLFGFGSPLGIDLPSEAPGFLPTREWKKEVKQEDWYIGDTYHLAIGQGDILVTPLQINSLTATVANGGTLYQPHLVMEKLQPEQNKNSIIQPQIINQDFIKPEHLNTIRQGLRQAVTSGSAIYLNSLPLTVAGKTGTAQVGGDAEPHAWFTGFAPYENPQIALTILIENGNEGSAVAVPVAYQILSWYYQNRLTNK